MNDHTIILPANGNGTGNGNGHDAAYKVTVIVPKRRYLSYLRERWWVVLVALVLCIAGIVTYETVRPESYSSFAEIHVAGDLQINNTGTMFSEDYDKYFGTQIELLKSPRLQGEAMERAGIVIKPGQSNPYKIDAVQPMKTTLFRLQATGPDPVTTRRYLQFLIDGYFQYKKDTRRNCSDEVVGSLSTEVQKRERELKQEQDQWADFQRSNNVAVLEEESKAAGLYLADLNVQVAKLKLERDLLEQGISLAQSGNSQKNATNMDSAIALALSDSNLVATASGDLMLRSARVELAALRAEKARSELSAMHPAMRKLDDEIAVAEKKVANLEQQNMAQKKLDLQELEKRIEAVKGAIPPMEAKVLGVSEKLSEAQRFKNNVQRLQNAYENLLSTLRNADLSKSMQHESLSLLQPPTPAQIDKRYLPIRIVVAALIAILASLGLVFGWYLMDDRFISVRDIKEQFGERVLGMVPQIKLARSKPEAALLKESDDRTAYAECYRHLRSALLLCRGKEDGPRTLLFTGAGPGEGKTTVAVNLGRMLARSGLRVAVVDADAHGGGAQRLLGGTIEPGVLDFLRGDASLAEIMQQTDLPGLGLVPSGFQTGNDDSLFLGQRLVELIAELKKDRDFVIFDGPPVLSADDAALLVPHVDSVVLVASPFYTRARLMRQALDMLYQRQAKQVTIVLNRARKDDLAGSYYARNGKSKAKILSA